MKSRYTPSSRREDRATLESDPSAGPDRNGARAETARSFQTFMTQSIPAKAINSGVWGGTPSRTSAELAPGCTSVLFRPTMPCICLVHESSIRPKFRHERLRPGFRNHTHSLFGARIATALTRSWTKTWFPALGPDTVVSCSKSTSSTRLNAAPPQ
jgi:hypothetical protein